MNTLIIKNYLRSSKASLQLFESRAQDLATHHRLDLRTKRSTRAGLEAYIEEADASIALFTLFSKGISEIAGCRPPSSSSRPATNEASSALGKIISKKITHFMSMFHEATYCDSLSLTAPDSRHLSLLALSQINDDLHRSAISIFKQSSFVFPPLQNTANMNLAQTLDRLIMVMNVVHSHRPLHRHTALAPTTNTHTLCKCPT